MAAEEFVRSREDVGNIIALEHVNVTVPDQELAHLFYVTGLGLTRDPFIDFGDRNMWVNVGRQQFHLPRGDPQVLRGTIGLVLPDLEGVQRRLERLAERFAGTRFACADRAAGLEVLCPWGNRIQCHPQAAKPGAMMLGISYVELTVPSGSAEAIADFYRGVMRAPARVEASAGAQVAVVDVGIEQSMRFRETGASIPAYDGHHVAIYVADFSGPHRRLAAQGLVFEESSAQQYRFREIPGADGSALFTLEHEVRSLTHPMWGRELVNRNPAQSLRRYRRGQDRLPI